MGRTYKFAKTELQYSGTVIRSKFMYIDILPEQEGELVYDGTEQFPTWKNLDPFKLLIEGERSATEAGIHYITVTPQGNFAWPNNLQTSIRIPYTIKRKKVSVIPSQKNSLTFNNSAQTPEWNNYDPTEIVIGGTYRDQVHADTYTATFTPDNNHCWADETFGAVYVNWKIGILPLAKPAASGATAFTYDETEQTLAVSNFNSTYMTQTGTIAATNAGDYTATFHLISSTDTCWADNSTDDVNISWSIAAKRIAKVTATSTSKTYNNAEQEPTYTNYDAYYITKSGNEAQENVGSYTTTFTLKDKNNIHWSDGTISDIVVNWAIGTLKITRVTASATTFQYTGSAQVPTFSNVNTNYMTKTGDAAQTERGAYSTIFSLNDPVNTEWANNSTADIIFDWTITKATFTIPAQSGTLTYNGEEQSAIWNFGASDFVTVTNGTKTAAGTYTATFALTDTANCQWSDGTTSNKSASWTIDKKVLTIPTATTLTYNGSAQTVSLYNFNSTYMNVSGNTQTNAGNYNATVSLKDTFNTCWTDTTATNKTVSWTINKKSFSKCYISGSSKTYNGSEQTVTIGFFDSTYMNVSGNSQTNAGTYTATVSLKSTANTQWSDGTTANLSLNWTINKLSLRKTYYSATGTLTKTVTYTGDELDATEFLAYFDETYLYLSGDYKKTNPGEYTFYVNHRNTNNTQWTDATTTPITMTLTIQNASINTSGWTKTMTVQGTTFGPTTGNISRTLKFSDYPNWKSTTSAPDYYISVQFYHPGYDSGVNAKPKLTSTWTASNSNIAYWETGVGALQSSYVSVFPYPKNPPASGESVSTTISVTFHYPNHNDVTFNNAFSITWVNDT